MPRTRGRISASTSSPSIAQGVAAEEPDLTTDVVGGVHWTDPASVSDPHGLTMAYVRLSSATAADSPPATRRPWN